MRLYEQFEVMKHKAGRPFDACARVRLSGSFAPEQRGFTLTELITIVVILGIISAVAAPRFFDRGSFDTRRAYDEVMATLRNAQKIAIAQRRFVCVTIAGNTVTLTYDATPPSTAHPAAVCAGSLALINPVTGAATYTVDAPNGVAVSPTAFSFDNLGRASAAQDIAVGDYPNHILVAAETGYVR